jgi:hypothetical protein
MFLIFTQKFKNLTFIKNFKNHIPQTFSHLASCHYKNCKRDDRKRDEGGFLLLLLPPTTHVE